MIEDSLSIGVNDSHLLSWADEMVWGDYSDWLQPKSEDLEPPPTLDLRVQEFLTGEGIPLARNRSEEDSDQSETP